MNKSFYTSVDKYVQLYIEGVAWDHLTMSLSEQDRAELQAVLRSEGYDGSVSSRAQIVLWHDEGRRKGEIAAMSGASRVTVDKWLGALREVRYGRSGEQDLPGWAASDPGPDTREGSRVDQDDTSGGIGDIALVINGDGPLHQENRGRLRIPDLGVAAVAGQRPAGSGWRALDRDRTRQPGV